MLKRHRLAAAVAAIIASPTAAVSHPHMLAEANLQVGIAPDGRTIQKLKHVWRFDDVSSSMFLVDLDLNGDLALDAAELKQGGKVMLESMAEYNYFQLVTHDGKDVEMNPPVEIVPTWENNILIVTLETTPKAALPLAGTVDIGVYDPTFFVAIDFASDDALQAASLPGSCARQVVRPNPDEAIAQNQGSLTDAFFNDPSGNDMGKIFATKLELKCQASG
jgi:ABC-type uncharacterized transport system substrate-binding protein